MKQEFLKMYDSNVDAIFRYCYRMTHSRDEARNITEETFRRAWDTHGENIPSIEESDTILRAIATKLLRQHNAKHSKPMPQFSMYFPNPNV